MRSCDTQMNHTALEPRPVWSPVPLLIPLYLLEDLVFMTLTWSPTLTLYLVLKHLLVLKLCFQTSVLRQRDPKS